MSRPSLAQRLEALPRHSGLFALEIYVRLDDVRDLLAADDPEIGTAQWQPIETAPNEVDVLAYFPDASDEYQVMVAHRIEGDWYPQDANACPDPLDVAPTHWMPRPNPPAAVRLSRTP